MMLAIYLILVPRLRINGSQAHSPIRLNGEMRLCRILQSMQHTQGDTKERELLKCVVAVKECIRGGGRHLQDVIFKH